MTKGQFNQMFKEMLVDCRDGYYGYDELRDECWYYLDNEQMRNKELWKEVKKLRKNLGISV